MLPKVRNHCWATWWWDQVRHWLVCTHQLISLLLFCAAIAVVIVVVTVLVGLYGVGIVTSQLYGRVEDMLVKH